MATIFDEAKDKANVVDHGISLSRAADFDFDSAYFDLDDREDYGEVRWNAIGFLDARLYALTFTEREGDYTRSAFARLRERKEYGMRKKAEKANDNPEWTDEKFKRSIRFDELPPDLRHALSSRKRGPQKAPKKVPVSIRLSSDVAEGLRAMGDGWQVRADDALRAWIKRQPKR